MDLIRKTTSILFFITACLAAFALPFPTYWMNLAFGIWMITWTVNVIFHYNEIKIQKPNKKNIQLYASIIFFLWIAVSMLWTENIKQGIHILTLRSSLIIFPILILLNVKNKIFHFKWLILAFICGTIISTIIDLGYCYYHSQTDPKITTDQIVELYTEYKHRTHFGICQCFAIISLYYLRENIIKYIKPLFYYLFFIIIYLLFFYAINFSEGRMTLIIYCILTSTIVSSFLWYKGWKKTTIISAIIIISLASVIIKNHPRLQNIKFNKENLQKFDPRYEQWRCAKICIQENNKIIGVGVGDHTDIFDKVHSRPTFKKYYFTVHSSHNQWLDGTIEYGIIGCILFLAIFICSNIGIKNNNDKILIINSTMMWLLLTMIEPMLFRIALIYTFVFFLMVSYWIKTEQK